jgi:DNA polymerase-1
MTEIENAGASGSLRADSAPRLVLIDGYYLLFRAYLTPGPYFSTSDGRPTGAVRGFANMLLTLLNQEKPDAVYVAWDAPGRTFRDERFEEYKAHRPPPADDLVAQFSVARQLVEAFGIQAVEEPGYEADDLIGTLAKRGVKEGYQVVIVTGDSDQLQLVREGVSLRMTRTGVTETDLYTPEKVREKYGIGPEQMADYKALVGDPTDNVPGVPGIGKVTATKLLQQWGSLENLLAHVDDLPPGKVRESLKNNRDLVRLCQELVTIHCDVPLEGEIRRYQPTPEDWERVRALFADLEFRTLLQRLPNPISREKSDPSPVSANAFQAEIVVLQSHEQLEAALQQVREAGAVALRPVTDGSSPTRATLLGIAFACAPDRGYYAPVVVGESTNATGDLFAEEGEEDTAYLSDLFAEESDEDAAFAAPLQAFESLLQQESVALLGHNVKSDLIVLARHGLPMRAPAFDAMVAAYLLNPGRAEYPLIDAAQEYLRRQAEPESPFTPETYAADEAAQIFALRAPMHARLEREGLSEVMYRIEMPLVPVLAEMERTGVPVNREWLERLSQEMGRKIEQVAQRIYELAGEEFTINSTQQLQRILFEKLQLPTGKKIKTGFSTRAHLLESLAPHHEIAARILEYRELTKLKSTYADALPRLIHPVTGRIHTSLNQTVTTTGRLSSSDPNLQNIPVRSEIGREIRKAFIAPPGHTLLSCDYSQIELRVFAHVTRDPEMLRAFAADEDIHAATATRLFNVPLDQVTGEMRRRAKTVNFAVIYGQSDFGLANTLGIPVEEARAFIQNYFAQFPGVQAYTEQTLAGARANGYVQTLLGRRRYLPEIHSGNYNIRQAAERAAVNMPIQGTAADIMKLAMIDVFRHLQQMCYNCTLLLQVHDELVFSVRTESLERAVSEIVPRMENAYRMEVRLRVDAKAGPNWAEMTPVTLPEPAP